MSFQSTSRCFGLTCLLACHSLALVQLAQAERSGENPATVESTRSEYYYPGPVTENQDYSIAQQKAMQRAQNRMTRMEINRRYGISPNRPTAVGVPFTSASTLTWTRPRAGMFVYNSGYYYRPYYYSTPYAYPYVVRR